MANLEKFNKVIFGLWTFAEREKVNNPQYNESARLLAELVDEINKQISINQSISRRCIMTMKKLHLKPDGKKLLIVSTKDKATVGNIDFDSKTLKVLPEYADDSEILFIQDYYKLASELI